MTTTLEMAERTMKHVWLEPRRRAELEAPFPWPGTDVEEIDFDWYEPRHDQPWRRQVARDREEFGGEHVAGPKPPVEGPNNPDRLRRELEWAEERLAEARIAALEAEDEEHEAHSQITALKNRGVEG